MAVAARRSIRTFRPIVSAAGLVIVAGTAHAKPPAALDLIPGDAVVAVGIRNVDELVNRVRAVAKTVGMQQDPIADGPLGMILAMPGLNTAGSVGVAMMPMPEGEEPGVVILVPVTDYAAMVAGAGGTIDGAVATLAMGPQTVYSKDVGSGYAAVSPDRLALTGFKGQAGQFEAHVKALGPVGLRVASECQAVVIANIPALSPQIDEAMSEIEDQMQMAMMLNPQAAAAGGQVAVVESLVDAVQRDARVGVMGLNIDEGGSVSLDLAVQFKDGSESATMCSNDGRASGLLARVPSVPFLLSFALDTSSSGMKDLMRRAERVAKAAAPADGQGGGSVFDPFGGLGAQIDSTDGYAVVWGQTPALFGGLFSNSAGFLKSSKPAQQLAAAQAAIEKLNATKAAGTTYSTTYTKGAIEVDGVKVDEWGVQMAMDPNDPMGMQAQQMQSMLFGPSGMGGFVGQTREGLVFTMARNTPLLKQAIQAAADGKGLAEQDAVKAVAAKLPASRTLEGYVGIKPILETVGQAMAMFGGGIGEITMPEHVPPLGISVTTDSGGAQFRLHAPADTIKAVGQTIRALTGEDEDAAPAKPAGAPRF